MREIIAHRNADSAVKDELSGDDEGELHLPRRYDLIRANSIAITSC